ncbi:MAG: ribbon-helix-helix protein, CopG family [Phycisphaerales bacterium]|nr:ribbon-helix-helix protein, CopG family [Phycisphaerales bacterium]
MAKKPISFTIDEDLLARLDRVAELRGETRTDVIERALRNDLPEQESMLESVANPLKREFVDRVLASPQLLRAIASVVNEKLPDDFEERAAKARPAIRSAGEKIQAERKAKKATTKKSRKDGSAG